MWELWVKFYLGQNQDYSLEDSTPDSSETLVWRVRGEGQYTCGFGEGGHEPCRRFLLVLWKLLLVNRGRHHHEGFGQCIVFIVAKSCPLLYDTLPWLTLSAGVCANSFPLSQWCHPTISSSVTLLMLKESEREVAQSCPTLCDPMDCSLPGLSVRGIFQARVLEWAAVSFSRGSSQPRDRTQVSCVADRHFTVWATREASNA